MLLFLDMDGVLCDFVGGICKAHGRASPYNLRGSMGYFDMENLWGMTLEQFWEPGNNFEFWRNLEKTPEADGIVSLAVDLVGVDNVAILTAPNQAPGCIPAKAGWIAQHYPAFKGHIIYGKAKRFLGGPDRILVDDKDTNVDDFEEVGGTGVLVPRLWNRDWPLADQTLTIVKDRMERIASLTSR